MNPTNGQYPSANDARLKLKKKSKMKPTDENSPSAANDARLKLKKKSKMEPTDENNPSAAKTAKDARLKLKKNSKIKRQIQQNSKMHPQIKPISKIQWVSIVRHPRPKFALILEKPEKEKALCGELLVNAAIPAPKRYKLMSRNHAKHGLTRKDKLMTVLGAVLFILWVLFMSCWTPKPPSQNFW